MASIDDRDQNDAGTAPEAAESPQPAGKHAAGAAGPRPLFAGERRAQRSQARPDATTNTRAVAPHPVSTERGRRRQTPYSDGRAISTRNPLKIVGIVAAVLIVLGGLGFVAFRFIAPGFFGRSDEQTVEAGKVVRLVVPDGSVAADIADILYNQGIIASKTEFSKELRNQNAASSLKSGAYQFTTGQDIASVVDQLVAGPNDTSGKITIPEGLTVGQTAAAVEAGLGIPAADFLAQAKASKYAQSYPFVAGAGEDSLEGFLAPKTYDFSGKNPSADEVIQTMLTQWKTEFEGVDFAFGELNISNTYHVQMNDYEIIKLASIIEREAVTPEDRPLVSSVFYNRMSRGMALQSDASMMYVTGGEVTVEDLKIESPYNTYLNEGLPPTPICNPSMESVQAALNPANTNYLFFYIVEDGTRSIHDFSETYEEHLAAIERASQG